MDQLAALLEGPCASEAFLLRCRLATPWAMRVHDDVPLTVLAVGAGDAVLLPTPDDDPVSLRDGDLAVVVGAGPYVVADHGDSEVRVVIGPDPAECRTLWGEPLHERLSLGVREWGDPAGSTVLLVGSYRRTGEVGRRVLDALPRVVVRRAGPRMSPALSMLAEEIGRDAAGQQVILDRLLDLVLIETLREWFVANGEHAPPWMRALEDPVIGAALDRIHTAPDRAWTVPSLAAEVGLSRAAFARRFQELVGEPPITYLTAWRMALAADLLDDSGATVAAVARQVGYDNPFTFSAAFKRHHGSSPSHFRDAKRAAPPVGARGS